LRVFFIGGSFLYAARSLDRDEGDRHFNFYKIRDIPWAAGDNEMIDVADILRSQSAWSTAAQTGGDAAASAASVGLAGLKSAVITLLENLATLDYPMVPGVIPPEADLDFRVRQLEATIGAPVPCGLVAFWRLVGGVSLVDLTAYAHVEFWEAHGVAGPHGFCDGVHVDPCSIDWVESTLQDFMDRVDDAELPPEQRHLLSLAPDGYHKDNISGGAPYGVEVGGDWLAPWQNFSWPGARRPVSAPPDPCDMLSYLRTSVLECAGFPGFFGVPAFDRFRQQLLRNVKVF
jgi:hypothetical protein